MTTERVPDWILWREFWDQLTGSEEAARAGAREFYEDRRFWDANGVSEHTDEVQAAFRAYVAEFRRLEAEAGSA